MKTTKMCKHFSLCLVLVFVLTVFSGCGKFDASGYTKACLDLVCKGETANYVKMTKQTEDQAKETYNGFIDAEIESMKSSGVPEDQLEDFRKLFEEIYSKAKYEVGEATQNKDKSFTVKVSVEQFKVFDGVMTNVQTKIQEEAIALQKKDKTPTNEELTVLAAKYMYEELKANVEKGEYAEKKEIEVPVTLSNNVYSISTTEYQTIFSELFDTASLQQ